MELSCEVLAWFKIIVQGVGLQVHYSTCTDPMSDLSLSARVTAANKDLAVRIIFISEIHLGPPAIITKWDQRIELHA